MLNINLYKKYKKIPGRILVMYLLFTIVLFAYGAFDWKVDEPFVFYSLIMMYVLFLYLGYIVGISANAPLHDTKLRSEQNILKWIKPFSLINCIMIFFMMVKDFGISDFEISTIWNRILYGFSDLGSGYYNKSYMHEINSGNLFGGRIFTVITLAWNFFGLNVLLLGIMYFKKVDLLTKIMCIISCILTFVWYIAIGTNIGVFRIVLALVLFKLISEIHKNLQDSERKKNRTKYKAWIIIGCIIVIVLFGITMKARGAYNKINQRGYKFAGYAIDRNSGFMKFIPDFLKDIVIMISSYLTQGYQGFALGLKTKWSPMFGLGGSYGLLKTLSKYGYNFIENTYAYKIDKLYGWSMDSNWCSMYLWIANDAGFFGVVIMMFIFGYMFAAATRDSLLSNNPYAKLMLYYLVLAAIFIPCNNQVVQTLYVYCAFLSTLFLWLVKGHLRISIR